MTPRRLTVALGLVLFTVALAQAHHPVELPPPSSWPPIVKAIMRGILALAVSVVVMAIITALVRRSSRDRPPP